MAGFNGIAFGFGTDLPVRLTKTTTVKTPSLFSATTCGICCKARADLRRQRSV